MLLSEATQASTKKHKNKKKGKMEWIFKTHGTQTTIAPFPFSFLLLN